MGGSSASNPLPTPTGRARPRDYRHRRNAGSAAYLNRGLRSSHGGEWLWGGGCPIVPRAPGLIWVHGPWAGDVMVDGSIRWERLRPLILRMTAALGRVSRQPRELAGRLGAIWGMGGHGGSDRRQLKRRAPRRRDRARAGCESSAGRVFWRSSATRAGARARAA